jgi:hypothetical protein
MRGAISAAALPTIWPLYAQIPEETRNEPLTIVRKGIDKDLEIISADLLAMKLKRSPSADSPPGFSFVAVIAAAESQAGSLLRLASTLVEKSPRPFHLASITHSWNDNLKFKD